MLTVPAQSPLGRVLADWSTFGYNSVAKRMIFCCNTAWPVCVKLRVRMAPECLSGIPSFHSVACKGGMGGWFGSLSLSRKPFGSVREALTVGEERILTQLL